MIVSPVLKPPMDGGQGPRSIRDSHDSSIDALPTCSSQRERERRGRWETRSPLGAFLLSTLDSYTIAARRFTTFLDASKLVYPDPTQRIPEELSTPLTAQAMQQARKLIFCDWCYLFAWLAGRCPS